jgi:formylglycine-generating enzyme required for sulfatase activity
MSDLLRHHDALADTRALLELVRRGQPRRRDSRAVLGAITRVRETQDPDLVNELLTTTLFRESEERYTEHVAPLMRSVGHSQFAMGAAPGSEAHFCGETPQHTVMLSPFAIASVPVTNALYGLLDPAYLDVPARDRDKPAVGVSWSDAALFALWVGCRLPTEAEWEFACAAGASTEWACASERDLRRYAWFSENSGGHIHPVATREPNSLGLHDFHGNVWEWCQDVYDQDFYASSVAVDPVARRRPGSVPTHRVTRGGCMHSFAEMCRTRYRFHEPPGFWASDLGFRLARSIDSRPTGGE